MHKWFWLLCLLLWSAPAVAQPAPPRPEAPSEVTSAFAPRVVLWSVSRGSLQEMAARWPGLESLRGLVDIETSVGGWQGRRWRQVYLTSPEVSWGELPLGRLTLVLRREEGASRARLQVEIQGALARVARADLEVDAEIDLLRGQIQWGQGFTEGALQVEGLALEKISEVFPLLALTGAAHGTVEVSGPPQWPIFKGDLQLEGVTWRGEQVGRASLRWEHRGRGSVFDLSWGPQGEPYALAHLRVPLLLDLRANRYQWLDDQPHALRLEAHGLTPERLRPFWKAHPAADFLVNLSAYGEGPLDKFWGRLDVQGELLDPGRAPLALDLTGTVASAEQTLELTLGQEVVKLDLRARAPLVKIRRQGARWEPAPLEGHLSLKIPMETLAPYLPGSLHDPRGELLGEVDVDGTLGEPLLQGEVHTEQAEVTLLGLNQRLRQVKMQMVLEGSSARLTQLEARCGPRGSLEGHGQASWRMTPDKLGAEDDFWSGWGLQAGARFQAQRLPVVQEGLPGGVFQGGLGVQWQAREGWTNLVFKAEHAEVKLAGRGMPPAGAFPQNRAVRRVDWKGRQRDYQSIFAGEGELYVDLDLREGLHLQGEGFVMDLGGRMQIARRGEEASVEGGFQAQPGGEFRLFGNRFEVLQGTLQMQGGDLRDRLSLNPSDEDYAKLHDPTQPAQAVPLEPVLDFVARGYAVDSHVLVKVQGPWRRPELALLSSPPLPEYQIMTLLITGRVDAVDENNGEVRRQVASLVSRFHNPSLSRQLYDRLGVDKLGLGFGSSVAQPIVTVGKQLNRQLYIETVYRHNAPPDQNEKEGHVEYRLNPRWTLDTVYGDAAQGSLGLFWQRSFGGPPVGEPPREWLPPREQEDEEDEPTPEPSSP